MFKYAFAFIIKTRGATMIVNNGKQGCQNCIFREKDPVFGLICQHKASIEGIEAIKNFYTPDEVHECTYYKYDENSVIDR